MSTTVRCESALQPRRRRLTSALLLLSLALGPGVRADEEKADTGQALPPADSSRNREIPDAVEPDPVATSLRQKPVYRHSVRSVEFSPDDSLLAVGTGEGLIHIWDVHQRKVVASWKAHEDWTFDVTFSPDGTQLVSGGGDNLVKVWKVGEWNEVARYTGHDDDVHGVAMTAAGRVISGGDDAVVIVHDPQRGRSTTLHGPEKQVTSVALSQDGKWLAASSRDTKLYLWSLETLDPIPLNNVHTLDVMQVRFAQRGRALLSGSYDGKIGLTFIESTQSPTTIGSHNDWVMGVTDTPNGTLILSGSGDQLVRVFHRATGKLLSAHTAFGDVSDLDITSDSALVAVGTAAGHVQLFELRDVTLLPARRLEFARPVPKPAAPLEPQAYLDLHQELLEGPSKPGWESRVGELSEQGDRFTLHLLNTTSHANLTPAQQELVEKLKARLSKQFNEASTVPPAHFASMLERAALSGLRCHPLEERLTSWTFTQLAAQVERPAARAELERLRSGFKPGVHGETSPDDITRRVQTYLEKILAARNDPSTSGGQ